MTFSAAHDCIQTTAGRPRAALVAKLWRRFRDAARQRRAIREIAALNDRTLADIGLSRPATFDTASEPLSRLLRF